jgi:hypothetical protein
MVYLVTTHRTERHNELEWAMTQDEAGQTAAFLERKVDWWAFGLVLWIITRIYLLILQFNYN